MTLCLKHLSKQRLEEVLACWLGKQRQGWWWSWRGWREPVKLRVGERRGEPGVSGKALTAPVCRLPAHKQHRESEISRAWLEITAEYKLVALLPSLQIRLWICMYCRAQAWLLSSFEYNLTNCKKQINRGSYASELLSCLLKILVLLLFYPLPCYLSPCSPLITFCFNSFPLVCCSYSSYPNPFTHFLPFALLLYPFPLSSSYIRLVLLLVFFQVSSIFMELYPLLTTHLPLILTDPPLISYHSFQTGNPSVMWLVVRVGEHGGLQSGDSSPTVYSHSLSQTAEIKHKGNI